jgi:hypothetical protein
MRTKPQRNKIEIDTRGFTIFVVFFFFTEKFDDPLGNVLAMDQLVTTAL